MNWQELSDRQLVELCLQCNENAWVEFLRRYRSLIGRVAARTLRGAAFPHTPESVDNLVGDSLDRLLANECRALRELEWRHDGALRGLLQVIASTVTQDHMRRLRSQKRDISKEVSLEPELVLPATDVSGKLEQTILLDQLAKCLERVIQGEPDCVRDVAIFRLFYGHRITAADLSRFYKINIRKVENTLARLGRLARAHCL
jgi:DNA-directed RNA polymerase specialized sigma24 family protein